MYDLVKVYLKPGVIPIEKVVYFRDGSEICTCYPTLHRGTLCDTIIFGEDYGHLAFRVRGKKLQMCRCNAKVVEVVKRERDFDVETALVGVVVRVAEG